VLARDASAKCVLYPLNGSAPAPVPGIEANDRILHWSTDGRSVLVGELSSVPARVDRVVLATGARSPVAELAPADRAAASYIYSASFSADERSHAYSLVRNRSYLYEVKAGR
jgi:hypothetical protein